MRPAVDHFDGGFIRTADEEILRPQRLPVSEIEDELAW
jgi:hypothetical protein